MKNGLVLERQEHTDKSTIGSIYYNQEFVCYSLERPWLNNAPFISCIKEGVYQLEPHKYKGRIDTFALVGDGVSHWENGLDRYAILIHSANYPSELGGCIAPALIKGHNKVGKSRPALEKLLAIIAENNIAELTIL